MNPSQNKLSPAVQALIALALLVMFAGVLFVPSFNPGFKVEADTKQTLFTLVTAVVFFFIGKNTDSANREAQITAAAIAPSPPPVVVPLAPTTPAGVPIVKVDDAQPVAVTQTSKEPKP